MEYVEGRTRTEHIGDWLWHRLGFLGHYMVLEQLHFEDIVRTALWNDVILQAANARRATTATASTGVGALEARLRTVRTGEEPPRLACFHLELEEDWRTTGAWR